MSEALQQTLERAVEFAGAGLHTGEPCRILITPAPKNAGIVFRRFGHSANDMRANIPASPHGVTRTDYGTTLANAHGQSVKTVEHLMAAFAVLSIDNVVIDVSGPEIPILDGSAAFFVKGMKEAGLTVQDAPRNEFVITERIEVRADDRFIVIEPAEKLSIDVSIEFEDCLIGRQSLSLNLSDSCEQDRLANSRTFCRLHEVEALRNAGLVRGGSLENSIVVDGARLLDDQELRDPQEFVLHKALDLLGDLYLLGGPIRGAIRAEKPGHDLNVRAAQAVARHIERRDGVWAEAVSA